MDLKCKMIMEEYKEQRPDFVELEDVVSGILRDITSQNETMYILAIEHRVKAEASLAGKLELKGDKYSSLADITDILGCRIICFFADDVDNIAKGIENYFDIDWENSVDKRAAIDAESFGYLSLHYICSLPFGKGYPDNICGKKFEIQIRTTLQHTWAVIDHDLGYKSEFGIPRAVKRGFSQVAGLLEVADEKFVHLRDEIFAYGDEVRDKIANNKADDLAIDTVSLREYMLRNKAMKDFLQSLADLCESCEIQNISPAIYIEQLKFLHIKTLGELSRMLENDKELATSLAKKMLESTDLDILSSNVGLRFLCRAELVNKKYDFAEIVDFMKLVYVDDQKAERQAKRLLALAQEL